MKQADTSCSRLNSRVARLLATPKKTQLITTINESPMADIPPEMVKYAKMAKSGKFKEFTRLAAERLALYVKSSALRMEMRGVEASQAQLDAVKKVQGDIGKVADRMDTFSSGKEWTQDDYVTMDYIVSEQMRLNPIK